MLSHAYNIVIDHGGVSPGNVKDIVDGLNATNKGFLKTLMTTVQLPGEATNHSQVFMYNAISNTDISIARVFQKIFQTQHVLMDWLIMENTGKI